MPNVLRSVVAVIALSAGCTSSDGGADIADTMLSGKVGGQAWTFQAGATDAFLSRGEDDFFAALYATAFTPCSISSEPIAPHILVSVPKQPGSYPFSTSRNLTFVVGDSDNLISLSGQIVVDSVTQTTVTGGLVTHRDDANDVTGRFTLTICPDTSLDR